MSETDTASKSDKVSLPPLTAMVVGSMIGSGVFLLPRRFGTETGVFGGSSPGCWNVDAGLRLSAAGHPTTRARRRHIRLCEGRIRRQRNLRLFRPAEAVLFGIIVLGAIAGVVSLITGAIEIWQAAQSRCWT